MLSPLGDYGGSTPTMHPLIGSPAILAADDSVGRIDQRGFDFFGVPTIGAVKVPRLSRIFVDSEATLRSALADTANTNGEILTFSPSLNGQTITLDGTQLTIPATTNGLFIDASDLPDGLTIDAGGQSRVMLVSRDATAALYGLTLTGGKDGTSAGSGGGILADTGSSLTLAACTISGNETGATLGFGGGIFAGFGSRLTLASSTVSENQARNGGGISYSGSRLTISNSTIAGNIALSNLGLGGGLYYTTPGVILTQSIVSENTGESGADIFGTNAGGDIITGSHSYVGDLAGWSGTATPLNLEDGSSNLAPLGDYGGPTETMIPLPGSPVVNPAAATASGRITDQRGRSNSGTPDIGAAEFKGDSDIQLAIPNLLEFHFDTDFDGDGTSFGNEFALGTGLFVSDADNPKNPTLSFEPNGNATIDFGVNPDANGSVVWIIERSTNLETWTDVFVGIINPSGSFTDTTTFARPRSYYRFVARPRN